MNPPAKNGMTGSELTGLIVDAHKFGLIVKSIEPDLFRALYAPVEPMTLY